ncbi:hypothetical protein GH714_026548 [Hevea brasiliensis]|uniref:S1 motif domain-containing protein n=1 Tax=Hevea brasiliensis TaxID=3981 RepID=A0A6A6MN79_HEVBR|nr:hypothetical protein GH714_026548 [Hevea brasiliensis]
MEGMILFSELSRRRIRSVSSLIKVGRIEPFIVLRVDKEKGYIELSKRRVSEEDIQACEERYNKSKLVHSIMRHVAETLGIDLEELYIHICWPLYRKYGLIDVLAFKIIVTDPDSVLNSLTREVKEIGPEELEVTKVVPAVSEEVKEALVKNIRRRMTPQPLKIRADIEIKCFQFDGVLHIKNAMRKAEAAGNKDCPVKIKLVAPPLYVLTTQTLDKEQGISILNKAIAACTEAIEQHKGKLVKEPPRAVSERDDKLLASTWLSYVMTTRRSVVMRIVKKMMEWEMLMWKTQEGPKKANGEPRPCNSDASITWSDNHESHSSNLVRIRRILMESMRWSEASKWEEETSVGSLGERSPPQPLLGFGECESSSRSGVGGQAITRCHQCGRGQY